MVSIYVVVKIKVIKQKLFTKIAIGVRQNFAVSFVTDISKFNVASKCLNMVQPLLPDKHRSSFQANLAESLLVRSFQMPLERCYVWKELPRRTIVDNAIQVSQLQTGFLRFPIMVVY